MANLYDRDFVLWTEEMAKLLRERRFSGLDIENLAEEVEDMGKRDRREVESRLEVLLMHLIKWQIQPDHRGGSWQSTINVQRGRLLRVLRDSPSLRRALENELPNAYESGKQSAFLETRSRPTLPATCPFTIEQILDPSFLPE
jgi:hypothetical protein